MKKTVRFLLSFLLVICIASTLAVTSFAAGTYKQYKEINISKMEYCVGTSWYKLSSSTTFDHMDGIRLLTNSSNFYLEYKVRDATHGWLSSVKSTDSAEYAGWYGYAAKNVSISVYNKINGFYDNSDYVVMYRARAGSTWCSWVSNASPDVMNIIQKEYSLGGALDTSATDAGDSRYGSITAFEIRFFERNSATPGKNAKVIDVKYYNQKAIGLPNGCEAVSAVMALNAMSYSLTPEKFVTDYLIKGALKTDPAVNFVGDPHLTGGQGWGCYAPVIKKSVDKVIKSEKHICKDVSGTSVSTLCSTYIDRNIPVIVWATTYLQTDSCTYSTWTTPSGKTIKYNNKQHCLLLVGYDSDNYYFNDPLTNVSGRKAIAYPKNLFEASYALMGSQAVVIDFAGSSSISVGSLPKKTAYLPGESFDPTGLVVKAAAPDGTSRVVNNYSLSSVDMSGIGEKVVTVSWTDDAGKTHKTQFSIYVVDTTPYLQGISAMYTGDREVYESGEELDIENISVFTMWKQSVINSDGSVSDEYYGEEVTEGFEISGFDSSSPGVQKIVISYNGEFTYLEFTVTDHIPGQTSVIAEATCTEGGVILTYCTLCGKECGREETEPLGHEFSDEFTVDREPTYTNEGEMSRHCIRCSERCDITSVDRIISTVIGDVDGDGRLNMKDVLAERKIVARILDIPEAYRANADVNFDGHINIKDVLLIRKAIAGLTTLG